MVVVVQLLLFERLLQLSPLVLLSDTSSSSPSPGVPPSSSRRATVSIAAAVLPKWDGPANAEEAEGPVAAVGVVVTGSLALAMERNT